MLSPYTKEFLKQFRDSPKKTINKLKSKLSKTENAIDKINILLTLSFFCISQGNFLESLEYAKKALDLSRKEKDVFLEIQSFLLIAEAYFFLGKLDIASQNIELIEILLHEDAFKDEKNLYTELLAHLCKIKGNISFSKREYSNALDLYKKCSKLYKKIDNKEAEAKILSNLGVVNQNIGKYDQAISYLNQAKEIYEEVDDHRGIGICLNNIAEVYRIQHKYKKAIEYYKQSLEIGTNRNSNFISFLAYFNLGLTYMTIQDYNKAKMYFENSVKLCNEIGNTSYLAMSYFYLGRIMVNLLDSKNVSNFILELEEQVSIHNSSELKYVHKILLALLKLNSGKRIERCKAIKIFDDLLNTETNIQEFYFYTGIQLCNFFFDELYAFEKEEILDELNSFFNQILEKINEHEDFILGLQIVLLYIHFLALVDERTTMNNYYNRTRKMLNNKNLTNFEKIMEEYWKIIQEAIEDINWRDYTIKERMELLGIKELLENIIERFV
ncbi:MAG: tetratricopeptide repeat protein [Candidatus Heimdallarchaeum aukensis]|uniref:Tetratricopeptide repeat protein n=1 Tax=Candidatus Heimdallarchaeum aukensis TaxID=2876573 RepID=A0A9Y1BLQ1_9ARCH|nr:MAG: tetratricopeptide repeat protein [Candidatus Heimdallarchaeum aukensis]